MCAGGYGAQEFDGDADADFGDAGDVVCEALAVVLDENRSIGRYINDSDLRLEAQWGR